MTTRTPLVELEPCFQEILRSLPPTDSLPPPEVRRAGYTAQSLDPQWVERTPPVYEEQMTIPNQAGNGSIYLTITRPLDTETKDLPIIVYFHGGGWVVGDVATHRRPRTELAVETHAAVVFVNYSLSPERRYPVALEECYTTVAWLSNNGKSIHMDPSKIVVVGDSAGGNLATAVTILAKQRDFPKIHAQVLFYPVLDSNFNTESYNTFAAGYAVSKDLMKWFWDQYADEKDRQLITASPLKASLEDLKGLPPALIISCEADVLSSEAEAYARNLLAAGVPVTALRILGTLHGFLDMNCYDSHAARAGLDQAIATIHRVWSN